MIKRLNSDLLLFFKTKKLCTSTFTVQVPVWEKRKEKRKEKKKKKKIFVAVKKITLPEEL